MSECAWVEERADALVRGERPPAGIAQHVEACPECRSTREGAARLRADLERWDVPEPPSDLVERTLARMAFAGRGAPDEDDAAPTGTERRGELLSFAQARRRTSFEVLTSLPLEPPPGSVAPSRRRLLVRLCVQAAAAALLFAVCTGFTAVFYPAITSALEDRRMDQCRQQLQRLQRGALLYRGEHPDGPDLRASELRRALVEAGYVDELDFVCPGHAGQDLQERSFVGALPGGAAPLAGNQALFWDRFGNHAFGFNVVYADGRAEVVRVDDFARWRLTGGVDAGGGEDAGAGE